MSRARSISSLAAALIALGAFIHDSAAHADSPRFGLTLDLGASDNVAYSNGGGAAVGLGLDLRTDILSVGLGVDATGTLVRGSAQIGFRLGKTLRLGSRTDLDLYAEAGASNVSAGGGFMNSDPGVSDWLPYLGTRFNLMYLTGDRHAPVVGRIGLSLFTRVDLEPARTYEVTYDDCWFFCDPKTTETTTASHTIGGGVTLGALFTIGFDFGG